MHIRWMEGIAVLLGYQLLGEAVVYLLDIPVPGPVVGMLLLFVTLLIRNNISLPLELTATGLLSHLSLMFIPAGVGVMVHFDRIEKEWLAISLALVLSAILTLALTALCMHWVQQYTSKGEGVDV